MATPLGFRATNMKNRRSFKKHRESEDENIYLDFTRDPKDIMQEILYHVVKTDVSKNRKLGYLNGLVRFCQKIEFSENVAYSYSDVFNCLRVSFFNEASEVRAAVLRACRYLLHHVEATEAFCLVKLHYLVARSLDVLLDNRLERIHAVRLMRKFLCVNPAGFPNVFTNCLIAVANEGVQERELFRPCLAILAQLALLNPDTFICSNGVGSLVRSVIDCQQPKICEAIMGSILFLYSDPKSRKMMKNHLGLEHLLAPFTDSHYYYPSEVIDRTFSEDRDSKLAATKLAVVTVLRSWSGITYFFRTDKPELPLLVQTLYLPYDDMRKNIMELLYDVFNFPLPEWTDDFSEAILSADPSASQTSWQLYEGYVVAEGCFVLPYVSVDRTNLIENYFALLLLLFVQAGVLEALVEVIVSGAIHLSVQATILLGELLYMSNKLLPSGCCHFCNSLPSLISAASAFRTPLEQSQASAAVSCLSRIHDLKKHGRLPSSLALDNLLHMCNPDRKRKNFFGGAISKAKLYHHIKKDMSDINQTIKDTLIFSKDFHYWDWDLIDNILKNPGEPLRKLEDGSHRNFIFKLLHFFLPCSKQFCEIECERESAQQIVLTGYHFVEFLLEIEESKSQEYLESFLHGINICLLEVIIENVPVNAVLSPSKLLSTLSFAYFIFIGKFSSSSKGCNFLDRYGLFQNLFHLVSTTNVNIYIKLIVPSLDYSKAGFSRTILSKVLTGTTEYSRLYATNFLRILLRARMVDFRKWAIEFLVAQMYDPSSIVSNAAIDVLEEACNIPENLETLIILRPALLHNGDKGLLLLLRFLSVTSGFAFLQDSNFLNYQMEKWKESYNLKYVKIVEDLLNEALTRHRKSEDGTYGRRSSDTRHIIQDVYLPYHMYGQLVQHVDGFEFLVNEHCLPELFASIRSPNFTSELEILQLKAALWAVGHVGSFPLGFSLLVKEDIVSHIVNLAANAPVITVRGTCFYVIGLLSATPEGAIILMESGWESIQRNHQEQWPIIKTAFDERMPLNPSPTWSLYSLNNSDRPLGGLPYSLSFAMYTTESLSTSQSSESLDIDSRKPSTSSSFSSTTSVHLPNNTFDSFIRPRSSSDCQLNPKDNQYSKQECASLNFFLNDENNHIEERSKQCCISVYQTLDNDNFKKKSHLLRNSSSFDNSNFSETGIHLYQNPSIAKTIPSSCPSSYSSNCKEEDRFMSPLTVPDTPTYAPHHSSPDVQLCKFATLKDSHGYTALKNIQRRRVHSLCNEEDSPYVIEGNAVHAKRMTIDSTPNLLQPMADLKISISTSESKVSPTSSNFSFHADRNSEKHYGNSSNPKELHFIGLCLPTRPNLLFLVSEESELTEGNENQSTSDDYMGLQLHSLNNCLANVTSHIKAGLLRTTIDEEIEDVISSESEQLLNVAEEEIILQRDNSTCDETSRNIKGLIKLCEDTTEGKALIRKEVMRCVTNLGSSVAVKASEQGLLNLKQRFPNAFQDICLYSEICLHIAKYNICLPGRRFLQELFLDSNFIQLQWEAESVPGVLSLPQSIAREI